MNRLRVLLTLALVGASAPSFAQVNTVPQLGQINQIVKQQTYAAVSRGLVPAASATDIWCINGSSTKSLAIKRIEVSGTAGTLVSLPVTLLRRATLNTGGTPAVSPALPVATAMLSTNAAATATLVAYTANPTITDASPTYFRSQWLTLPTTAAGTIINPIIWDFSTSQDILAQGLDIRAGSSGTPPGTTTQYCINLNAVSVSSGLLDINVFWTEN